MNEREKRTIYTALLRGIAAAARIEHRRALYASVDWPIDAKAEATDIALMRGYMNHAKAEAAAAEARQRWQRREGR